MSNCSWQYPLRRRYHKRRIHARRCAQRTFWWCWRFWIGILPREIRSTCLQSSSNGCFTPYMARPLHGMAIPSVRYCQCIETWGREAKIQERRNHWRSKDQARCEDRDIVENPAICSDSSNGGIGRKARPSPKVTRVNLNVAQFIYAPVDSLTSPAVPTVLASATSDSCSSLNGAGLVPWSWRYLSSNKM